MLPREAVQVGGFFRVPLLVEDTAVHLPHYFSPPIFRQVAYRHSLDIPSSYHAEGLLGSLASDRAPIKVRSRRKHNLEAVKKPFKSSQKRKGLRKYFQEGRNSSKMPFQANNKTRKGNNEVQTPTSMVARALALADEARALHALWRAGGPAGTQAKSVQKLKNESQRQGSVDLIEEVRALHSLWRAGPAGTGDGWKKVDFHLDLGLPSKIIIQTEPVNAPKKPPKGKKKKKARRPTLIKHSVAVQLPSTPHSVKAVTRFNAKFEGFSAEEAASTSSARRAGVSLMIKEEEFEMPMEPQKDTCKHATGLLCSDHGGIELLKLSPDEERADSEIPTELQKDACKHVMEFLSTVDGGMGLENLTPNEEKAMEFLGGTRTSLLGKSTIDDVVCCHSGQWFHGADRIFLSKICYETAIVGNTAMVVLARLIS
ncbi:hypothetical protein GOP47_0012724 [Adiantum capillus-veneris]|uniref:Uncharacterized protein n=1 Tax=Adiantum capillus-veneris TaxID=13818 RepID=A0A9D4USL3_ADICA|nr:hypothetical protein GOP47_0012724 [Adiantum capillus-veneris]